MIGRLLCALGLHSWTFWELGTQTYWDGNKPKDMATQRRECIRCGWHQVRIILGRQI